jgi:hypothetical protein
MNNTKITNDQNFIREWIQKRNGNPVVIKIADNMTDEIENTLEIVFDTAAEEKKYTILTWDDFFSRLEISHLAFMYEEDAVFDTNNKFYKFIWRNGE